MWCIPTMKGAAWSKAARTLLWWRPTAAPFVFIGCKTLIETHVLALKPRMSSVSAWCILSIDFEILSKACSSCQPNIWHASSYDTWSVSQESTCLASQQWAWLIVCSSGIQMPFAGGDVMFSKRIRIDQPRVILQINVTLKIERGRTRSEKFDQNGSSMNNNTLWGYHHDQQSHINMFPREPQRFFWMQCEWTHMLIHMYTHICSKWYNWTQNKFKTVSNLNKTRTHMLMSKTTGRFRWSFNSGVGVNVNLQRTNVMWLRPCKLSPYI